MLDPQEINLSFLENVDRSLFKKKITNKQNHPQVLVATSSNAVQWIIFEPEEESFDLSRISIRQVTGGDTIYAKRRYFESVVREF